MSFSIESQFDTEYSADSIEFCPISGFNSYFLIGTYQVDTTDSELQNKNEILRKGRLYLCKSKNISVEQELECSAILDMKWSHFPMNSVPIAAVVTSTGELIIYNLFNSHSKSRGCSSHDTREDSLIKENGIADGFEEGFQLQEILKIKHDDGLNLSVDFQNRINDGFGHNVVVSVSNGSIKYYQIRESELFELSNYYAHSFEAWIASFDYHNSNLIYSGGDDCKLKIWDIRSNSAVSTNNNHEAGVTSISKNHNNEYEFVTGSYDENIRLWDIRMQSKPKLTKNTAGGVWRLKWHPDKDLLLAACMYNNFHIYTNELQHVLEYNYHKSIAYGCDWCYDSDYIGTCSFYDHLCTTWTYSHSSVVASSPNT